jgi:hypothetical protein
LRRIVMQDSTSWKAIRFLNPCNKISELLFLVMLTYMYMTPWMRADLILFGDVIFLDAQQRQFNSYGFPYISPVLHDDKGKIAQGAKSIVVEELHEIYAWVLTKMARLESRFWLDEIRIIFADMGITNSFLKNC